MVIYNHTGASLFVCYRFNFIFVQMFVVKINNVDIFTQSSPNKQKYVSQFLRFDRLQIHKNPKSISAVLCI